MTYVIICCLLYFGMPFSTHGMDSVLITHEEHSKFIRSSLKSAQERVIIVSPYISSRTLQNNEDNEFDGLEKHIKDAINRDIKVCVFTDKSTTSNNTNIGRKILTDIGVELIILSQLHSKNLIIDNDCITFGSFNWLSANTNITSIFYNYETTTIIHNEPAYSAIDKVLEGLMKLKVTDIQGMPSCAFVDYIFHEAEVEKVIELYRSTNNSYLNLACSNVLCEHLVFCGNHNTRMKILRETADKDTEVFQYFIDNVLQSMIDYCDTSSEYEELERFFIVINKQEVAAKVAMYLKR